jgi:hypothetical protein
MFYKGDRVYVKEFDTCGTVNFTIAHSEPLEDRSEVTLDTPTYYGNPPRPMWTLMFFSKELQPRN